MATITDTTGPRADALRRLAQRRRRIDQEIEDQVSLMREANDSWATIGACLGITRTGAHAHYGKRGQQ